MITALLLGWMTIAVLATYGTYRYWRNVARRFDAPPGDGVVVIIPIKGRAGQDAALSHFLDTCLAQDGVTLRLVAAVESQSDPAVPVLTRYAADRPNVSLVIAGRATDRGQKVHNQLAALETLRPDDRFVVFADADIVLASDWLSQLLRPLLMGRAHLASGYRWILPSDGAFASRCCALADWGVATATRSKRWNLCWGGSIAITRHALERIDLLRWWAHSALDDIVLTRAARQAGFATHAPHQVLAPSPVRHTWRSLFDFGRRQYLFVRVHAPLHWCCAGVTLALPTVAGVAAMAGAARGEATAIACLAAALLLQQVRAELRVGIARRVLPHADAASSAALIRRDRFKIPLIHCIHLSIWLTSAFGRTMLWAGNRYRLTGFARAEIVDHVSPG